MTSRGPAGAHAVRAQPALSTADVAIAAQLACLLEVSAPKPWNVSPGRHFGDLRYEDFLASATAIGAPLADAGTRPVGVTIRRAIEASARWSTSNANLGIVLLLVPLARAALTTSGDAPARSVIPDALRTTLRDVLQATTVDDAREAYAAIRLASPGGLGRADAQDVNDNPTMTLLDVMRLAAERDGVAREYATGYATTFETALPALERARGDDLSWDDAIVEAFLVLLAERPDTHIVRRSGEAMAAAVSRHASDALAAGGVRSADGRRAIADMDASLRDARNSANPGTTADLIAATIFVSLLCGGWRRDRRDV
jgi:triphosphoribosyl-dephospho-CoA synthase